MTTITDEIQAKMRMLALRDELAPIYDDDEGPREVFRVARDRALVHRVTDPREVMIVVYSLARTREDDLRAASAVASYAAVLARLHPQDGVDPDARGGYFAALIAADLERYLVAGGSADLEDIDAGELSCLGDAPWWFDRES